MSYLCRAERQVRVKANASNPDRHLNLNAPSRGSQVCRTSKPGICKSSFSERMCQVKQHGFFACVYRISTATKRVSTDSVNEEKKCLVKWFFCNLVEEYMFHHEFPLQQFNPCFPIHYSFDSLQFVDVALGYSVGDV